MHMFLRWEDSWNDRVLHNYCVFKTEYITCGPFVLEAANSLNWCCKTRGRNIIYLHRLWKWSCSVNINQLLPAGGWMVKKQICHLFLQLEKLRHGGQGAHFQDNRDMSQPLAKLVIPKTLASRNLVSDAHISTPVMDHWEKLLHAWSKQKRKTELEISPDSKKEPREGATVHVPSQDMSWPCWELPESRREVLLYLQRAWAGSSASASPVGRVAACDNVWLHSPGPGKPPKTLSTPRCQRRSADSWDGWRGGAPPPATPQRTGMEGKIITPCSLCAGVQPLGISISSPENCPVTQPGKTLIMDAGYNPCLEIRWDRNNSPQCSLTQAGFGPRRLKTNFKRWQLLL